MTKPSRAQKAVKRAKGFLIQDEGKELEFSNHEFNPRDYYGAIEETKRKGLFVPPAELLANLIYETINPENKQNLVLVFQAMLRNRIWIFNRNLWTREGVYVIDDSKGEFPERIDRAELENILSRGRIVDEIRFSHDNSLRFAPRGTYQLGNQRSLWRNGFIVATYGERWAKKLDELEKLSRKNGLFRYGPVVEGIRIKKGEREVLTASSIELGGDSTLVFHGEESLYENNHLFALSTPYTPKRTDLKKPANT